jgi:hypothetical protein
LQDPQQTMAAPGDGPGKWWWRSVVDGGTQE